MTTCESCGKTYNVGEWPWCPHGIPNGMLGEFKPYWDDNLGPEPVYVTSLAQRNNLMADKSGARGFRLEYAEPRVRSKQDAIDRLMARSEAHQRRIREMR